MASASTRLHLLPAPSLPPSRAFQKPADLPIVRFSRRIGVRSSQGSSWEAEEARWIREEQRWLREEQRWLREESRWDSERQAFIRDIEALKIEIEALREDRMSQMESSGVGLISNLSGLLQSLKAADLNPLSASNQIQIPPQIEYKETVPKDIPVLGAARERNDLSKKRSLRKGSEGDDVRAMQEALQRLGFYSGEEDMEFSSFSSGTERAVKTWQASVGFSQDGVMTSDLLEALYKELQPRENSNTEGTTGLVAGKDGVNGSAQASITSVSEVSEIKQILLKDGDVMETEISEHKVFLLGENRWEEPSRLTGAKPQARKDQTKSGTKCLACRGEGRLMCTECDGTGEPNVEPQFLEWVDEGAKCPYCEGLGYTVCDVCNGKAITP